MSALRGLSCAALIGGGAWAVGDGSAQRIVLTPVQGEMICYADPPGLPGQRFVLGVPETIGCREQMMLLNFPDVKGRLRWTGPDSTGSVAAHWSTPGLLSYRLRAIPGADVVDLEIEITNLSDEDWHDVFAFNCLNPVRAPQFKDWDHERTYLSRAGRAVPLVAMRRNPGRRPTVSIYLPEAKGEVHPFAAASGGISPDRSDGAWMVSLSEPPGAYIAATSDSAAFLFANQDRCCLHSAADFGTIVAGNSQSVRSRMYFAAGDLQTFLKRIEHR